MPMATERRIAVDNTTDPKTLEFMQHYAVGMYDYACKMNEPFALYMMHPDIIKTVHLTPEAAEAAKEGEKTK